MSYSISSSISEKPSTAPLDGDASPPLNGHATPPRAAAAAHIASPTEFIIACVYPTTLLAASVFRNLSSDPASSTSYFSQKGNIFNVFFVKYGWFWTTVAFALHVSRLRTSSRSKAAIRWALATVWWIAITQWFFGAPIMDRAFTITGGKCQLIEDNPMAAADELGTGGMLITSAACKVAGGTWSGGHDLSGHVFMLTHASLFLWSEVLPTLSLNQGMSMENGTVLAMLGLWWWMLLMTGIYFHTWREKLTGLIIALIEWAILYVWTLKTQPVAREVVGTPGV